MGRAGSRKGVLILPRLRHIGHVTGLMSAMETARSQFGVISLEQLRDAGVSARSVERHVRTGKLVRVAYRTFRFPIVEPSWHQDVMSAVLTGGPSALASHATAAVLYGLLDRPLDQVEIVVPRWQRTQQPPFRVHESKDLLPVDYANVDGIPATTPTRTVVDLGASAPWLVEKALERGIRQSAFTLVDISAFIARVGRKGRAGVGVIRPHVESRLHWDGLTESDLEDLFRRVWGTREPQPIPQYIIEDRRWGFVCRTDFAFPSAKVRIELDSEAFHMDRPTFRRDRQIQNRTELLGWRTFRYTWWDLTDRPEAVVAEVRAALEAP